MQWAPLAVPLGSGSADFEGFPPVLGDSVLDLMVCERSGDP